MQRNRWDESGEANLVAAARAGDLRAFDTLARRYRPAVVLLAQGILGRRDLAEDAAQDSLLAAFSALPHLEDDDRFGPWLGTIVRNRARRLAVGERRTPVPLDAIVLAYAPALAERVIRSEDNRAIRCALARLPPEVRPVLELYYLDDWSVREISLFLSLPETTVKWRLHAGRKHLRTLLPDFEETL
jgi:RNA polymerase sigma-70 factor (ECF subfamily)